MERKFLLAFFVFVLVGIPGYSQPCLTIDNSVFDFGEAIDGAVVEHVFVLKNTGDAVLKIFRIAYNCSCTSYEIPKTEIASGEWVPLTVRFNTTGYSTYSQPVSQTLTIFSNDPVGPHRITVQGRVLSPKPTTTTEPSPGQASLPSPTALPPGVPPKPTLVNLQVDLVTSEDAEAVLPILELIESYGWRTTVYVTGEIALAYPNLVKEIHDRGHQIGVLGWEAGEDLLSLSEEELYDRLENAFLAVRAAVGDMRPQYIADFKPQGYQVNETLLQVLARLEVRSCTSVFPDGPVHPHHLERYRLVAIPLTRVSTAEEAQIVLLADDEYLRAGKSIQDFLADLWNTYEANRHIFKPLVIHVHPSLGWLDHEHFEALNAFLAYVNETAGKVAVVDLLTVQANPFIAWIKVTGPTSASPGKQITINIEYEATCYCPAYLFHIYGRYPDESWALLSTQYYPTAYIRVGTHSFTVNIKLPELAKGPTYTLRVVGRACHGGGCVPGPEDYEAMAEHYVSVQLATVEVQIIRIVPVQVIEGFPLVRNKATAVRVFIGLRGVEDGQLVKAQVQVNFEDQEKTTSIWLGNWDGKTYCFPNENLASTFSELVRKAQENYSERSALETWLKSRLYWWGIDSVNLEPFFPKTTGEMAIHVKVTIDGAPTIEREEWCTVKEHLGERRMLFQRFVPTPYWLSFFELDQDSIAKLAEQQLQFVRATYPIPETQIASEVVFDPYITCRNCPGPFDPPAILQNLPGLSAPALSTICALGRYWRCVFVVPDKYTAWARPPKGFYGMAFLVIHNIVLLNEKNPLRDTLAHEIGHTYGLDGLADQDVPSLAGDGWEVGHRLPCKVSRERNEITSPLNYYDFMTDYPSKHGREVWISTANYEKLMNKLLVGGADPLILWVSGLIYEDDTVELLPFYLLEGSAEDLGPGSYSFEALDADGSVLGVTTFEPTFIEGVCPFSFAIPYFEGTRRIVLKHGTTPLAEVPVTPHSPEITSLTITALDGERYSVMWEAIDIDGDDLHYVLFYSHNSSDWLPLASLNEPSFEFDTSLLPGGMARIKVVATDGVNTVEAISSPFFVTTKYPAVSILFPEDGASFQFGSEVDFVGGAYDPEDGRLAGASLLWTSDINGTLGTGELLRVPFLSPGTHRITLTATDSEGRTATASIQIRIEVPAPAIIGRITSYTGAPVEGALIEVRGPSHASALTDANGWYALVNLEPGEYTVFVTPQSPNLMRRSTSIALGPDQVISLDFTLEVAGSIGGSVTDATGAPISGVWIRPGPIWQEPPHYQVINGEYIIPGLSAGTYTIEIDTPGYGDWYIYVNDQYVTRGTSVTVEVELGKTTRVDFTQRSPGTGVVYDFEYASQAEAEAAGWTFTGLWRLISEDRARRFSPRPTPFPSPTRAAYFGTENGNYVTLGTLGTEVPPDRPELRLMQGGGRRSYGELTSPTIPVSGVSSIELSFQYFRVVEYYPKGSYDKTYVQVSFDGGSWETVWSLDSTTPSEPVWKTAGPIVISVPTGASTMRVRFVFDSVDHFYNNYLGWLIDNIRIMSTAPGVTRFTYSNLAVNPTAGPVPLRITASATVTNIGTTRGTETVRFFVDGVERATRAVTLDPGASTTVSFDYTFTEPGSYSVTIDGLPPVAVRAGVTLFYEGFGAGATDWEFTSLWHIISDGACFQCEKLSGSYAYYAQGCNYDTRARTEGTLTSPVIDLQGAQFVQIRFDHFRHVEQYAGGDFDRTRLEVSFDDGSWTTVWMKSSKHPSPECGTVTIGPFAVPSGANSMRLRFVFDSVDKYYNNFPGWAVDNVTVAPASSGQPLAALAIEAAAPRSLAELISVFNVPNPVRDVHTTTFVVRGVEAEEIRVEVYDLTGRLVWQGEGLGNELSWGTQDLMGLPLANGVYLWRVWVRVGEEWVASAIQKLVILR